MKRWFRKFSFSFLVAYRNMRAHKIRTLLLVIGFVGISIAILLSLSMRDVFYTYFYGNRSETYQDIDLKIAVDNHSSSRFFSITPLNDSEVLDDTDGIYPFFEFDVLTKIGENERVYVHAFVSSIDMLSHLSNHQTNRVSLNNSEVIITQSFAETYGLSMDDQVILAAGNQEKTYQIVDIFEDSKLFTGMSIFIDKETSMSFFLTALHPSLAGLPPLLLRNIYSTLYVDLKEDVSFDDAVQSFQSLNGYGSLNYMKTIDEDLINQQIDRNTALLSALLSLVFVAIIFVLQTTLNVYFHERKSQASTINVLGGRYRYGMSMVGIELMLEQLIAFLIAILITNVSIAFGMDYLDAAWSYQLSINHMMSAFVITLVFTLIMFSYYGYRYLKYSNMSFIKRVGDEKRLNVWFYLEIAISSLVLFGIAYIPFIESNIGHIISVIRMICVAIFLISFSVFLYQGITQWFKRYKEKNHSYYHLKILSGKKGFSLYLSMMLVVSLIVFLLVFMIQHLNQRILRVENENQVDFVVTRMVGREAIIDQEIALMSEVTHSDRADIYYDVHVSDVNINLDFAVSMDVFDMQAYFNIENMDILAQHLNESQTLAVILPMRYHEIYRYDIGDDVQLSIYDDAVFQIVGFFEKQGFDMAFTNAYMIDTAISENANSILVNSDIGNEEALFHLLLDEYSSQMVIVIDFQGVYIEPFLTQMISIKNFIIGFIGLLMLCFIMTLANHQTMLNIAMAYDHAHMLAIGFSYKQLIKDALKVESMIFGIVAMMTTITYVMIFFQIEGLFATFKAFETIEFNMLAIIIGLSINAVLFYMMFFIKIMREKKLDIVDYLRIF